jgi:hypothetical protein
LYLYVNVRYHLCSDVVYRSMSYDDADIVREMATYEVRIYQSE